MVAPPLHLTPLPFIIVQGTLGRGCPMRAARPAPQNLQIILDYSIYSENEIRTDHTGFIFENSKALVGDGKRSDR